MRRDDGARGFHSLIIRQRKEGDLGNKFSISDCNVFERKNWLETKHNERDEQAIAFLTVEGLPSFRSPLLPPWAVLFQSWTCRLR